LTLFVIFVILYLLGGIMMLTDLKKLDKQRFSLLVFKIKATKQNYVQFMNENEHLQGSRFNDDNRIARMILGYFYGEAKMDYVIANQNFLLTDSQAIETYIKKAVLESASADHWYTNEKAW